MMPEKQKKVSFFRKICNPRIIDRTLATIITIGVCVYSMLDRDRIQIAPMPHLEKDRFCESNYYAECQFSTEDSEKTAQAKMEYLKKLPLFYRIAPNAEIEVERFMEDFFKEADRRQALEEQKLPYKKAETPGGIEASRLSLKTLRAVAEIYRNQTVFKALKETILSLVKEGLRGSLKETVVPSKKVMIRDSLNRTPNNPVNFSELKTVSQEAHRLAGDNLASYSKRDRDEISEKLVAAFEKILSRGQMQIDEDSKKEWESRNRIEPVTRTFKQGTLLLKKGKKIEDSDIRLMEAHRDALQNRMNAKKHRRMERIIQNIAISILMLLFCGIYLYHIHRDILSSVIIIRMMTFTTVIAIFFNMLASHVFVEILEKQYSVPHDLLYIILPLGFAPLVLSVTYGMRCALFTGLFISMIAALSTIDPFHVILMGLIIGALSSFSVRRVRNYRNFFISGFLTISFTTALLCTLVLWRNCPPGEEISLRMLTWACTLPFASGLITAGAALIMVFVMEAVFEVTTNMSLLLYGDYSNPLLRRLQLEAPGTYFHSLSVASLAEAAAQQIGANPIKARTCALFHDVGKLSNPEFFTENNVGADPHKDLDPETSAKIILDHVNDGMVLAKKYKLRVLLRDAIQQHHGTDIVRFFYNKAQQSGRPVDEEKFRYKGPLPRQKEIALVMLADACEAASRSLERPDSPQIEKLVSSIIDQRLRSGQLDAANLTFRELRSIKESFIKTLPPMLHARVAYPTKTVTNENDLLVDKTN